MATPMAEPPMWDRLRRVLKSPPLSDARVDVDQSSRRKVTATVVSPTFEGQNEAVRQRTVWMAVLSQLADQDVETVEFIFTYTPGEAEELGLTR